MPNRCENCNKFTSLEFQEPEVEEFGGDLDLDLDTGTLEGTVSAVVRITRASECCSETMKEASLEMSEEVKVENDTLKAHLSLSKDKKWAWKKGCEVSLEHEDAEQVEESIRKKKGSRFPTSYFGASLAFTVTCTCGQGDPLYEGELEDKVAASEMDDA
jgi:hypothetical protein